MQLLRDLARRPLEAVTAGILVLLLILLLMPLATGGGAGDDALTDPVPTQAPAAPTSTTPAAAASQPTKPAPAKPIATAKPPAVPRVVAGLAAKPYTFSGSLQESVTCDCRAAFTRRQTLQGAVASRTRATWTARNRRGPVVTVLNGTTLTQRGGGMGDVTAPITLSAPLNPESPIRIPTAAWIARAGKWVPTKLGATPAMTTTVTLRSASLTRLLSDSWNFTLQTEPEAMSVRQGEVTIWVSAAAPHRVLRQRASVVIHAPRTALGPATYERRLDLTYTRHGTPVRVPRSAFAR
jgi:hypothetical protein